MTDSLRAQIAAMIVDLRQTRRGHYPSPCAYTQRAVARAIGVSQQRYSNYETAKCDIPLRRLRRIYHYLGGNFAEIVALYANTDSADEEEEDACLDAAA